MTEPRVSDIGALREARTAVVHGLYRLLKVCFLHQGATNDAVTSAANTLALSVANVCKRTSNNEANLVFVGDAVFVNGVILKASREMLASALELGAMLGACDVSEVTFAHDVGRLDVSMFARLFADVYRDRSTLVRLQTDAIPGITTGKAKPFASSAVVPEDSGASRAARTYALAIMSVQRMMVDLKQGKFALPRKIKRIAQRIVADADADTRALVALAAVGGAAGDNAGIAVASAVLAVAMARQLTTERHLLLNVGMGALLHDVGQPRLSGSSAGVTRTLNDDELDRLPSSSAVILTAMGKIHPSARERTVLVYEAWWRRRAHRIGPVYKGRRTPTVLSRIVAVARSFAELRATQEATGALSVDDAIQVLMNRAPDATERTFVKLLVGGLGIFPAGTMVELNTGELAVVLLTPPMPVDFVRPPVKVMYDKDSNLLEEPFDVDLADRQEGEPLRFIRRTIHADDAQLKAMRSFVVAAIASQRRAAIEPEPPPPAPSANSVAVTAPPPRSQLAATSPPPRSTADASVAATAPPPRLAGDVVSTAPPPPRGAASDVAPRAAEPPPPERPAPPPVPPRRQPPADVAIPPPVVAPAAVPAPAVSPAQPAPASEEAAEAPAAAVSQETRDQLLAAFLAEMDEPPPKTPSSIPARAADPPSRPPAVLGRLFEPPSSRHNKVPEQGRPLSRNEGEPPPAIEEAVVPKDTTPASAPAPAPVPVHLASPRRLRPPIRRTDSDAPPPSVEEVIPASTPIVPPSAPPQATPPVAPTEAHARAEAKPEVPPPRAPDGDEEEFLDDGDIEDA